MSNFAQKKLFHNINYYYDVLRDDKKWKDLKKLVLILRHLKQQGHEAYFVGGSVRDLIIDRPIGDIVLHICSTRRSDWLYFQEMFLVVLSMELLNCCRENWWALWVNYFFEQKRILRFSKDLLCVQFVRFIKKEDLNVSWFHDECNCYDRRKQNVWFICWTEAIQQREIVTVGNAADRFQKCPANDCVVFGVVSTLGFSLENENESKAIETHGHFALYYSRLENCLTGTYCVKRSQRIVETKLFLICHIYKCQRETVKSYAV